jgi:hypothetical protein
MIGAVNALKRRITRFKSICGKEAIAHGGEKAKEFIKKMEDDTMMKQLPLMEDIANRAVHPTWPAKSQAVLLTSPAARPAR